MKIINYKTIPTENVTGWKVIRKGRLSCSIGRDTNKTQAQRYLKNKPTKQRKGWGPLCFFETKEQAIKFIQQYEIIDYWYDLSAVLCKAEMYLFKEKEEPGFAYSSAGVRANKLKRVGNVFENAVIHESAWPYGTRFAKSITCLE